MENQHDDDGNSQSANGRQNGGGRSLAVGKDESLVAPVTAPPAPAGRRLQFSPATGPCAGGPGGVDPAVTYGVSATGMVRHQVSRGKTAVCGKKLTLVTDSYNDVLPVCRNCDGLQEGRTTDHFLHAKSKNPRLFALNCPPCQRAARAYLGAGMDASAAVMKRHPRCSSCGVLTGQGHLDAGPGRCGTCSNAGRVFTPHPLRGPGRRGAVMTP